MPLSSLTRQCVGTTTNVAFSRPIRWLVALLGNAVIPFEYAGVASGRTTLGARPDGSPALKIKSAADYLDTLREQSIIADVDERRAVIQKQIEKLAESVGGEIVDLPGLLDEVTNLVEQPTALLGHFEENYLALPRDVLVTVMRKHQRYFPLQKDGQLLPYFVAVRNGGKRHLSTVMHGNEGVLRARFADAEFFFRHDTSKRLDDFLPRLGTLTFQEKLGSVLDKVRRIEQLTPRIAEMLGLSRTRIAGRQSRGALVQGRPGDADGGRAHVAAGRDGPRVRACGRANRPTWRRQSGSITCRAMRAISCRDALPGDRRWPGGSAG